MKKLIQKIKYLLKSVPDFTQCKHASCWDGSNAQKRMMNILSPKFDDGKFNTYMKWMKARGCDTVHVILVNAADGEGGGYNCAVDAGAADLAKRRIKKLFIEGFSIVPWIITDDSKKYAEDLFAHADERIKFLADHGLFDHASYVVLGLEMDEESNYPKGVSNWPKVANALRQHYKGKIGTHHCSGNSFRYAGLGDIVLGQLEPKNATYGNIAEQIRYIKGLGKHAVGFEYERFANRNKAQAALDSGAIGCGNW